MKKMLNFNPDLCIMNLYLSSLNSGSNGNCYYVGNDDDAILVDAGISCRETERRMARLGLSVSKVRAIFISHEHSDHTRGVEVISRKHRIPVYITRETHKNSRLYLDPALVRPFLTDEHLQINSLTVRPFLKLHDGIDPHSFTVTSGGLTAGVFTDIGMACDQLIHHAGRCDAAFLEANYDEEMLDKGNYPVYLKRRIRGDKGHLSNLQALEIFRNNCSSRMKLLVLSHLSANNNRPQIVHDLFSAHANGTRIAVASRYEESELFCIPQEDRVLNENGFEKGSEPWQTKLF
jgi:phosphoribosyl 1,2-cyclic phosphodiesterase